MTTYAATVLEDGAVGYWRLGENLFASAATDQAGNQNGAYVNTSGLTFAQTGIPGGLGDTAVAFTAANHGGVTVADNAFQHVGDAFSQECWAIVAPNGGFQCLGVGLGPSNSGSWVWYINSAGKIEVYRRAVVLISTSTITVPNDGDYHHLVWTKSGATNRLYIDGIDVTGTISNSTIINTTAGIQLGNDAGSIQSLNGTLDEYAIYPAALMPSQVLAHYALGSSVSGGPLYTIPVGPVQERAYSMSVGPVEEVTYPYYQYQPVPTLFSGPQKPLGLGPDPELTGY